MADRTRTLLSGIPGILGLQRLVTLSGQRDIFPFYHAVSDTPLPHIRHLYPVKSVAAFRRDLEEMLTVFEPASVETCLEKVPEKGSRPRMILSFDDGLGECHSVIAPILKQMGIPAIFFLNNRFIDNRGLFFRYRAGILVDRLSSDPEATRKVAEFLALPPKRVREALLLIGPGQEPLLNAVAGELGWNEEAYLREQPVYMTTAQIRELHDWGFQLGAHSLDHSPLHRMGPDEVVKEVRESMNDLEGRVPVRVRAFSFPHTSDGIPPEVIDRLLNGGTVQLLFGTAGLKRTGRPRFVQRIPMEVLPVPALRLLRAEYRYYLLKGLVGRNRYFKR